MSDRSQGASAGLRDGRNIEIMIQRRHSTHDDDGLGDEKLDEKDPNTILLGVKTSAKYWMQISNVGESKQR